MNMQTPQHFNTPSSIKSMNSSRLLVGSQSLETSKKKQINAKRRKPEQPSGNSLINVPLEMSTPDEEAKIVTPFEKSGIHIKRQIPKPTKIQRPKIIDSKKFDEKKRQTLSHHKKTLRPKFDSCQKVNKKKRQEALKYMCESLPEVLEQTRKEDIPKHLLDILKTILKQLDVNVATGCTCEGKCNSAHCNCLKSRTICKWGCECSGYCENCCRFTRKTQKNI